MDIRRLKRYKQYLCSEIRHLISVRGLGPILTQDQSPGPTLQKRVLRVRGVCRKEEGRSIGFCGGGNTSVGQEKEGIRGG